jgi:hypothetical protein
LIIDQLLLTAKNNTIDVNQVSLAYQGNRVELKGRVDLLKDEFVFDLDASAGALKWDASEKISEKPPEKFPTPSNESTKKKSNQNHRKYPVSGKINLSAESFTWEQYSWTPFQAEFFLEQDKVKMEVTKAGLCGIDMFGTLMVDGDTMDLDFQCTAKGRDIVSTNKCLSTTQIELSGNYDFFGHINAHGPSDELFHNAKGQFDFKARKGVITKDKKLSRILEVVNFTEIVKGRIPDLNTKGFGYKTIKVEGEFSDSMMVFDKIYMDGNTLDLLGKGTLDLKQMILNVELLAAPFKTVDSAIKSIPGINYLMAGNLISIPVRVEGNAADPKVSIMNVSDISSSFLDFAKRAIKSPIKLIESMNFYHKPESKP